MSALPKAQEGHDGEPALQIRLMQDGSCKVLDLPWPEPGLADSEEELACLPE